jgi:hypothetical protein
LLKQTLGVVLGGSSGILHQLEIVIFLLQQCTTVSRLLAFMTLEMNHATTQEGLMRIGKFRKDTTDMHRLRMALTGHISLNRTKHWWQVHLFMITLSTFGGVKDLGRINRMSYSLSVVSGIIVDVFSDLYSYSSIEQFWGCAVV